MSRSEEPAIPWSQELIKQGYDLLSSDTWDVYMIVLHYKNVKTMSMEKEITSVLGENKALFMTWK